MSCSTLRHRFDTEIRNGQISFVKALEFYQDVEGSVSAHRVELEELMENGSKTDEIKHLQEHIGEGEQLIEEIEQLQLH